MVDSANDSTELRVLQMMRKILTRVARETATRPGARQVLSDETVRDIRDCLAVISQRQLELSDSDELSERRPSYPEGNSSRRVEVKLESIQRPPRKK